MDISKRILTTAAASLFLFSAAANSKTIDIGDYPNPGVIPPGYAGFNWGTGATQATNANIGPYFADISGPGAAVVAFGRATPFDLNSVSYQVYGSASINHGAYDSFTTVVSGYLGSTFVKSVTEHYIGENIGNTPNDAFSFNGLNIDGVTSITFKTTDAYGAYDSAANYGTSGPVTIYGTASVPTYVDTLNVSNYKAHSAPEMDPASTMSGLMLLLGGLCVMRGRRTSENAPLASI